MFVEFSLANLGCNYGGVIINSTEITYTKFKYTIQTFL